jgi:hypothetical protein
MTQRRDANEGLRLLLKLIQNVGHVRRLARVESPQAEVPLLGALFSERYQGIKINKATETAIIGGEKKATGRRNDHLSERWAP